MTSKKFVTLIDKYRALALENNQTSNHIALLLNGSKVISYAVNNYCRNFFNRKRIPTIHAEINCVRSLKSSKKFDLLILRFKKDGTLADSRPCTVCKNYLISQGFTNVHCSLDNGLIKKFNLKRMETDFTGSYKRVYLKI